MSSSPGGQLGFRSERSRGPVLIEFFRHHGIWAPGVRLFRLMQFRAKALMISLVFIVPVVALGWSFFNDKADAIAFSAKERLGVGYAGAVVPLLAGAIQDRQAATPQGTVGGEGSTRDAQQRKLADVEKALGDELGTGKAYAALRAASDALKSAASPAGHNRVVESLLELLGNATDGSNLTLDPDLDSYYVMDAATTRGPQIMDLISRMQQHGMAVLAGDVARPEALQQAADTAALLYYHHEQMRTSIGKAVQATPSLAAALSADDALTRTQSLIDLVRGGLFDTTRGKVTLEALTQATQAAAAAHATLSGRGLAALDALLERRIERMQVLRNATAVIVGLSLLLGAYLFYCFFLVTQGGLREVQKHLEAMTSGDLTTSPNPWGKDEAAQLMGSLSEMQLSLRTIVEQVRHTSDSIVQASQQIAAASDDLSARTDSSAASLEQTASAIDQISSTVGTTADSARTVAQVAAVNSTVAGTCGEAMGGVARTMAQLHDSSRQIVQIIETINGIAFQTNILALNAAVESARAGEQGRGFAVVASEVRKLAGRSAEAAKEIAALIKTSVDRIDEGSRIVGTAVKSSGELVDHADRMKSLVSEISAATAEQSLGVQQVSGAIQQLDQSTQHNATLVQQTTAASGSLRQMAEDLGQQVGRFKLVAMSRA